MRGFSAERDHLQPSLEGTVALVMNGGEASLPSSPKGGDGAREESGEAGEEAGGAGEEAGGAGEEAGGAKEEADRALASVLRK